MNKNPLKQLMKTRHLKQREYARLVGLDETWVSIKLKKGTFNLTELIELAGFTDTQLAFVDKDSKEVVIAFDSSDEETVE